MGVLKQISNTERNWVVNRPIKFEDKREMKCLEILDNFSTFWDRSLSSQVPIDLPRLSLTWTDFETSWDFRSEILWFYSFGERFSYLFFWGKLVNFATKAESRRKRVHHHGACHERIENNSGFRFLLCEVEPLSRLRLCVGWESFFCHQTPCIPIWEVTNLSDYYPSFSNEYVL